MLPVRREHPVFGLGDFDGVPDRPTSASCPSCGSTGTSVTADRTDRAAETVLCVNNLSSRPQADDGAAARGVCGAAQLVDLFGGQRVSRRSADDGTVAGDPGFAGLLLARRSAATGPTRSRAAVRRGDAASRSAARRSSPTKLELRHRLDARSSAGMPRRAATPGCASSAASASTTPPARWASRSWSWPTRPARAGRLPGAAHLPRRAAAAAPNTPWSARWSTACSARRWVYDAPHDPVYVDRLLALVQGQAEPQAQSESDTPEPAVEGHAGWTPRS